MSDKIKKPMKSFVDDIRMMRPRIVRDTMRKVDLTVLPWETLSIGQATLTKIMNQCVTYSRKNQ